MKGLGYVGYGEVTKEAAPIGNFVKPRFRLKGCFSMPFSVTWPSIPRVTGEVTSMRRCQSWLLLKSRRAARGWMRGSGNRSAGRQAPTVGRPRLIPLREG